MDVIANQIEAVSLLAELTSGGWTRDTVGENFYRHPTNPQYTIRHHVKTGEFGFSPELLEFLTTLLEFGAFPSVD
jgi:hypothetical protein